MIAPLGLLLTLPLVAGSDDPELAARLAAAVAEAAPGEELALAAWYGAVGEGPSWSLEADRALPCPADPPPWLSAAREADGAVRASAAAAALRSALADPEGFGATRLEPLDHALLGRATTLRLLRTGGAWLAAGRWTQGERAFDYVVVLAATGAERDGPSRGWRALAAAEEELCFAARAACGLPAVGAYRFGQPFEAAPADAPPRVVVPRGAHRVAGPFPRFATGARPGDVVADIGCGTGADARALAAALGPTSRVLGRDVDERRIPARHPTGNLEIALSTLDDVAIEPETLDLAYMRQVLHYVLGQEDTREAFAASLLAALKPGGRLFVIQHGSARSSGDDEAAGGMALFAGAGFERGPLWRIHDGRDGRRTYLVLELRRPPR